MSYCLELNHLTLSKKKQIVLEDCTVQFKGGVYYAILGDNLVDLQFLMDYFDDATTTDSGTVIMTEFQKEEVYNITKDNGLFENLNLMDNILIGKQFSLKKRFGRRNQEKAILTYMKEIGAMISLKTPIQKLTVGEIKIIELLRGYFLNRKVYILDNIYSFMDLKEREVFDRILTTLLKEGKIVILLTNSIENSLRRSDEIFVFYDKKISEHMPSEQMRKNPRRVLRKLNGWETSGNASDTLFDDSTKFLELLVNTSEISTMTQEMEQIFLEFIKFGHQYLNVENIVIYLYDYNNDNYISSIDQENKNYALKEAIVEQLLEKQQFLTMTYKDNHFYEMFCSEVSFRTVLIESFEIEKSVKGLIVFFYHDYYLYTQKDYGIVRALTKELELAIEKSRLLGKSVLLQESHHRIKNNLQLIVSTLSLQKMFYEEKTNLSGGEVIEKVISQIKSIASVHEFVSKNENDTNMVHIFDIIQQISDIYTTEQISIQLVMDDIIFPYHSASSLAIIINELINNSVKYGKKAGHLQIEIICKKRKDVISVTVKDNGKGFPETENGIELKNGLGLTLLTNIVKDEFRSEVNLKNSNGAITSFDIQRKYILAN